MLFNSFTFPFFFLSACAGYWTIRSEGGKNLFLLICSYLFYGYWDYRFLLLLWFVTLVAYWGGYLIGGTKRVKNHILAICLFLLLSVLFSFKYTIFFLDSICSIVSEFGIEVELKKINIILPVGISDVRLGYCM